MRRAMPKNSRRPPRRWSLNNGNFVARLSIPAKVASQQSGIPHQLIVAQAALESGWGQSEIPTSDGTPSYNLFGIRPAAAGTAGDGDHHHRVRTGRGEEGEGEVSGLRFVCRSDR